MALEVTKADNVPANLRVPSGPFHPTEQAVDFVYGRIAYDVRIKVWDDFEYGDIKPRLKQAIRRHIMSPPDKAQRMLQNRVAYDFLGDWDEMVTHFVWCMKAYNWRAYEIEMAMCAARSRAVEFSINRGIEIALEVTKHALYPDPSKVRHYDWLGALSDKAQGTRKVYFTYLPEKPSFRWLIMLGQKGRGFKRSVVLLHDLLQIAWDSFSGPAASKPLAAPLEAQTGPMEMKKVNMQVMKQASDFLKQHGLPVEYGPSMTTVRFCQINNLRAKCKSPTHPYEEPPLTKFERQCIVWGLFSYWTLFYQKSYGQAHNFQFANNSAEQLGCGMAPVNSYPDIATVKRTLGTQWTPADDLILTQRLAALQRGIDQASVLHETMPKVVG